jgi:hypothetical protein
MAILIGKAGSSHVDLSLNLLAARYQQRVAVDFASGLDCYGGI